MTSNIPSAGAIAFGLLSGLIGVIDIPPLIWHIKQKNLGASTLVFWFVLLNFMSFLNAMIWPTSIPSQAFSGVGICDIEVKLLVASWNALPACLIVIMRGLARVMNPEDVTPFPTSAEKRRARAIEAIICWGIPIVLAALHYVVQDLRFYVDPGMGCNVGTDNSWPSVVLVFIPPSILALIAGYYAGLLFVRLYRYRRQFRTILEASNTSRARFQRLWQLSTICLLWVIPQSIYMTVNNSLIPYHPFSFSQVHDPATWDQIIFNDKPFAVSPDRWIRIGGGILLFVFFGVGADAVTMYKGWILKSGVGRFVPSLLNEPSTPRSPLDSTTDSRTSKAWSKTKAMFSSRRGSKGNDTGSSVTATSPGSPLSPLDASPLSAKSYHSSSTTKSDITMEPAVSPRSMLGGDEISPPDRAVLNPWPASKGGANGDMPPA